MERLSSKRASRETDRLKLKQEQLVATYTDPSRLVSNGASVFASLDYGGDNRNKKCNKSHEGPRIASRNSTLSDGTGSKYSNNSGSYMVNSSHRVRRQE